MLVKSIIGAGEATGGLADVAIHEVSAALVTTVLSSKPLRATIATRIALMQLRFALAALQFKAVLPGAAQAPVASIHWLILLSPAPLFGEAEIPYWA